MAISKECVEAAKLDDPTDHPMPYLRAVYRESHRLTPITEFFQASPPTNMAITIMSSPADRSRHAWRS